MILYHPSDGSWREVLPKLHVHAHVLGCCSEKWIFFYPSSVSCPQAVAGTLKAVKGSLRSEITAGAERRYYNVMTS